MKALGGIVFELWGFKDRGSKLRSNIWLVNNFWPDWPIFAKVDFYLFLNYNYTVYQILSKSESVGCSPHCELTWNDPSGESAEERDTFGSFHVQSTWSPDMTITDLNDFWLVCWIPWKKNSPNITFFGWPRSEIQVIELWPKRFDPNL